MNFNVKYVNVNYVKIYLKLCVKSINKVKKVIWENYIVLNIRAKFASRLVDNNGQRAYYIITYHPY